MKLATEDEYLNSTSLYEYAEAAGTDPVVVWGDVMSGVSIALGIILPIVFWMHRNHHLIELRMPGVVCLELVINMICLFVIASQYGNWYYDIWADGPCFIQNSLTASTNFVMFIIMLARIVTFYRMAQVNIQKTNVPYFIDMLVHYVGILCAPREFQRQELKLRLLQKELDFKTSFGRGSASYKSTELNNTKKSDQDLSIHEIAHNVKQVRLLKEYGLWTLKIAAWFIVCCLLAFFPVGYYFDGPTIYETNEEGWETCSNANIRFIGFVLVLLNLVQFGIVVSCYNWMQDSLGLKSEIVLVQIILSLVWTANGFVQLIDPLEYDKYGVWLDLTVITFHQILTFAYPLMLLYFRKYHSSKIKRNGLDKVKTVEDFEKLWKDPTGREKLFELAQKRFATETILYISETDFLLQQRESSSLNVPAAGHSHSTKQMESIVKKYFGSDAPFELNLPIKLFTNCTSLQEKIIVARKHVIEMFLVNFKDDIEEQFRDVEAGNKSNRNDSKVLKTADVSNE